MHFLFNEKFYTLSQILLKFVLESPNRCQAITWTNGDHYVQSHVTPLGHNELTHQSLDQNNVDL